MILTFTLPVILFALLLFTKKKLLRKHWYMLFSLGLVFTLLVSFVSVWSVWNPYALSDSLHEGRKYSGASSLSYPLQMSVYVGELTDQDFTVVGNVSFDVSIANQNVLETDGVLSYDLVTVLKGAPAPVSYQLEPPFSSDPIYLFRFVLLLVTLFDIVGLALGLILVYAVSRVLATRTQVEANNRSHDID